jgi:hypothetical protein
MANVTQVYPRELSTLSEGQHVLIVEAFDDDGESHTYEGQFSRYNVHYNEIWLYHPVVITYDLHSEISRDQLETCRYIVGDKDYVFAFLDENDDPIFINDPSLVNPQERYEGK